jgi:ribosomal protein L35
MFSALLRSTSTLLSKGRGAYYSTWMNSKLITSSHNTSYLNNMPSILSLLKMKKNIVINNNTCERGLAYKACLKTNKSAAKRFRVRGNDRIKRNKAGRSHNTGHKGRKRVNRLAASAPINGKAIENRMRRLIGA